ncbi:AAA family ATPase [Amnibacterium soli]|uniref:AAA family ATPase n=1 Tax=Amnibacterium soli TaxID=1282736 RepID=A0ABP8YT04_9MICO
MVRLIVLSGPPGIGKSTVADAVAALHPAVRLSIDDVEEAMRACGLAARQTGVAAYEVVRAAAEQNLAQGLDVVVDAVNDSEPARGTWRRAAAATGAALLQIVLVIDDAATHRTRLEGRTRPFVHLAEPAWDAVVVARPDRWGPGVLRLDAAHPVEELARSVLAAVPSSPPSHPAA